MKKLIIIPLLFILLSVQGQIGRYPFYRGTGVAAGPANMISNGTFDDDTGWDVGAAWSIDGGVASATDFSSLTQYVADMVSPIETGVSYKLDFDIVATGANNIRFYTNDNSTNLGITANYGTGHHSVTFTAPEITSGSFTVYPTSGTFSIDNIVLIVDE